MTSTLPIEQVISAVYQTQDEVDTVIKRLLDRGIATSEISVMGRNFESKTRIAGFITKKDIILGGLKQGAIFGSLFGSVLSLLTGVGVLFIPFVGPVVAAGPLGAALLGAASGALAGSAGAGLASALMTLGMPEEKATLYQTLLAAGEFLVMAEVPTDRSGEFRLLMENAGGKELHVTEKPLPRPCKGRCTGVESLAPEVRSHLSEAAQQTFIDRYNQVFDETQDESAAEQTAWETIRQTYETDDQGVWSRAKVLATK